MKILLIRHGTTPGNSEKRYVGRTDEGLTAQALLDLKRKAPGIQALAHDPAALVTSPMKRCMETAEALFPKNQYPDLSRIQESGLRECDFGEFEYKNYLELSGNARYQHFIDTMGREGFPGGETTDAFKERTLGAFRNVLAEILPEADRPDQTIVFVVHGGTIMAVMEAYSEEQKDYYDWQIKNGEGIMGEIRESGGTFRIIGAQMVRL